MTMNSKDDDDVTLHLHGRAKNDTSVQGPLFSAPLQLFPIFQSPNLLGYKIEKSISAKKRIW